eukprot:SAG31_NODE_19258_length_608_cov_0.691552_2_plen_44_part_01
MAASGVAEVSLFGLTVGIASSNNPGGRDVRTKVARLSKRLDMKA